MTKVWVKTFTILLADDNSGIKNSCWITVYMDTGYSKQHVLAIRKKKEDSTKLSHIVHLQDVTNIWRPSLIILYMDISTNRERKRDSISLH